MKFALQVFGVAVTVVALVALAEMRPGYVSNIALMQGLLLLEVVLAAVWHYEQWYFLILMMTFLWAGSSLPMAGAGLAARWVFLIVGGAVGVIKWGAGREKQRFSAIHLVALLCVVSAVASGMASTRTRSSDLKCSSLLLLFLYGSFGARVAVADREGAFFRGLVTACEAVSFLSGLSYIALRFALFGNPNALGAIMGVAIVPILAWGVLISDNRQVRYRRTIALCIAGYLLFLSASRAGLFASAVTLTVMCFVLRRGSLLVKGVLVLIFMITAYGVVQPSHFDPLVSDFMEQMMYKGKMDQGLLGSRKTPWQETVAALNESPWFGSGFGTDRMAGQILQRSSFRTVEGTAREHGSSYMALLQYVGLLGVIPFAVLLLLVFSQVIRTCTWMRRQGTSQNYAVPLAMLCLAGLLHAVFEDWLFAPGYYLSLLFWTSAFLLPDFLPQRTAEAPFASGTLHRSES